MGQTIGRAPLPNKCGRFLNLPKRCIFDLWEAFNDIAEGFGLTIEEFAEILKSATMEFLQVTEKNLGPDIDALFRLLDDDSNNLVDSLEFISALAMLSGMTSEEKTRFIFAMYDFGESASLTLDEMVLAYRSSLSGTCKLCRIEPPTEQEIEDTIAIVFDQLKEANNRSANPTDDVLQIDRELFVNFTLTTPDVFAWLEYFDDLAEYQL
eukprot:gene40730-49672_t